MIVALLTTSLKAMRALLVATLAVGGALAPFASALPLIVAVERGQDSDLEGLMRQLAAPEARDRALAACRISRLRGQDVGAAFDALVGLLGDGTAVAGELCRERGNWRGPGREDSSPGREAAIALQRLGSQALDPVVEVLRSGNPVARENAALALGLIENSRAVRPLAATLTDAVDGVRARAAWALGMIQDPAAVEPLGRALSDSSAEARAQAAWALGMIEASSAVPALVDALTDADEEVREQAAWALGMIGDGGAVDALMEAIEDEDPGVRKQALWALLRCVDGDDEALDYAELQRRLRKVLIGGA